VGRSSAILVCRRGCDRSLQGPNLIVLRIHTQSGQLVHRGCCRVGRCWQWGFHRASRRLSCVLLVELKKLVDVYGIARVD
jgi:hypothetical protein